jgi:hypothetical protein
MRHCGPPRAGKSRRKPHRGLWCRGSRDGNPVVDFDDDVVLRPAGDCIDRGGFIAAICRAKRRGVDQDEAASAASCFAVRKRKNLPSNIKRDAFRGCPLCSMK